MVTLSDIRRSILDKPSRGEDVVYVNIDDSATVTLARKIPEPATAAMVLLGAGGLICRRRAA